MCILDLALATDAEPTIAACAVVRNGGLDLRFWLVGLRAAGVRRVYLHDDDSTDETQQVRRAGVTWFGCAH